MRRAVAGGALGLCLAAAAAPVSGTADLAEAGRVLFSRAWLPDSAEGGGDGLGPLFNEASCNGCHFRGGASTFVAMADGRVAARGVVARLGDGAGAPDPVLGRQLQNQAVDGLEPEGRILARIEAGRLVLEARFGPVAPASGVAVGFRQAPPLAGRAAIATIDPAAVAALADPDDRDGDGISGRLRGDPDRPGRFGWKAATATLEEQVAAAFAADIGLGSSLVPRRAGDCTAAQAACREAAGEGKSHELDADSIPAIARFLATLELPARPDDQAGELLLAEAGCTACHVPALPDRGGRPVEAYTDLLLHDLGPGLVDLAGEPGAFPAEWRTAPLIALDPLGGRRRYLHDGRAATIAEAIALHGGEAGGSAAAFARLHERSRLALIRYLEGL